MAENSTHEIHPHVSAAEDKMYHQRLPMGSDEKTIAIYRHHWFAYVSILFVVLCVITILLGSAAALVSQGGAGGLGQYKDTVVAGTVLLSVIILLFALIPVWLRSQERLVLSDDSLYQLLQPSLFAGKVSQLNLAHLADVTVRQNFFGTIFGYAQLTIETPGEQDNFEYTMLGNAHEAAREILEVHENYIAALESGRLPTTFTGVHANATAAIDPKQYAEFLEFQRMQQQAQADRQTLQEMSQNSPAQASAPDEAAAAKETAATNKQNSTGDWPEFRS